jgi:glycosyltransferase involved in cell wall biosynthesis
LAWQTRGDPLAPKDSLLQPGILTGNPNLVALEHGGLMKGRIERAQVQIGRRYRQLRKLWATEGPLGLSVRIRLAAAERIAPPSGIMPVEKADILAADLSNPLPVATLTVNEGQPIVINWVSIPAGPSGGHTTMYRIIRYLETHGYVNRVYFYNVYQGDHRYYESIVRSFYDFHGTVAGVDEGMADAHAVVATSWATAYPVFNSARTGKRFYFVQDFEPYFHPVGALSFLAENTYRMGFHGITAGRWLAQKLRADYGMCADFFDFGSDVSCYQLLHGVKRSGIVFYARPEAARRGFELGLMAIELFAKRHPDITIHLYGAKMGTLPFRFLNHGRVTAEQLNRIYNQCYAGLSLSMTNVSLVPHEMLAAGCIPVVNDADHNRVVLDNPFVRYVTPYPRAVADELEALVTMHDFDSHSKAASRSVCSSTWDDAGAAVDAVFRRALKANGPVDIAASQRPLQSHSRTTSL